MNLLSTLKEIKTKKQVVLVIGLGVSGVDAARVLHHSGLSVIAVDKAANSEFVARGQLVQIDDLRKQGIKVVTGIDGEALRPYLNEVALCVLSPGISLQSPAASVVLSLKIPIVNELELALDLIAAPTIVLTGSNGKSTTVSLIHEMLVESRKTEAALCGNIGTPVISLLNGIDLTDPSNRRPAGPLVVEASSYQLESSHHIHPNIAVWLNISENHLERHGTLENYLAIKARVFENQGAHDCAVINCDDSNYVKVIPKIKAKLFCFGRDEGILRNVARDYSLVEYSPSEGKDRIVLKLNGGVEVYDLQEFKLLGLHNRYDAAAAILSARLAGATENGCRAALGKFAGLKHRYQKLGVLGGALYINDSKSTTVAATCAAFESSVEANLNSRIHLLIGGMAKLGSWQPLIDQVNSFTSHLNPVICFGGDGPLIYDLFKMAQIPAVLVPKMKDAFLSAKSRASCGDVVLFSPGCASFDEFQNFVKRGEAFQDLFNQYEHDNTDIERNCREGKRRDHPKEAS